MNIGKMRRKLQRRLDKIDVKRKAAKLARKLRADAGDVGVLLAKSLNDSDSHADGDAGGD